jgi:hypothetical protein
MPHSPPTNVRSPHPVRNIDGTSNVAGPISCFAELGLKIGDHKEEKAVFIVTDLGSDDVIIGIDWLRYHNPEIDWNTGKFALTHCPISCKKKAKRKEKHLAKKKELEELKKWIEGEAEILIKIWSISRPVTIEEITNEDEDLFIKAKASVATELAVQEAESKKKKTFKELVPEWLHNFRKVSLEEKSMWFPENKKWDHKINFKDDNDLLLNAKAYPLSPKELDILKDWLAGKYKLGRLRDSESPVAAPFFFVAKKDGKLRPVQDYRKLNEKMIKNAYPLPRAQDLIDKLTKATLFSKMDVRWGYNNIWIREGDQWKAAFKTPFGYHEPLVMYFGMTNSPATFQTMMDEILQDLKEGKVVIVYIDNILVFTNKGKEHHWEIVREVLQRLQDHDLFLKPEKCSFEQEKVEFLGMIIEKGQVFMDPIKVEGVKNWPTPMCVKDIQTFMGFANFYWRFILGFSNIARPMNDLLWKSVEWSWGEK